EEELTVAEYERLAAEMAELGTFVVSIEGGEALVRKDIADVVRALARPPGTHDPSPREGALLGPRGRPGHVPLLFTNGWYVTDALARALFDAGLAQASV